MLTRATLLKRGLAAAAALYGPKSLSTADAVAPKSVWFAWSAPFDQRVLISSGGLCAPATIYSEFASRPLHDALPAFSVKRGGVAVD